MFFLSFVLSSQLVQHCPESTCINIRFQESVSSCTTSFVEHRFLLATFCHHKYSKRRIVCSCGHPERFNPAVITNKEAHMVYGNMNKESGASQAAAGGKKRSAIFAGDQIRRDRRIKSPDVSLA